MEIIWRRNKRKYQTQKIAKCTVTSSSYQHNATVTSGVLYCCFLLYFRVYCNMSLSYTFKSTYNYQSLCVVVSIHRPRGIFILQTSDFEIQTLQLAFQTSKFGLQTCSLHDKCLCTQAQTIFFRTILIVKTALAAMFDIGWGSSTKPLKGDPNYIIYPKFW